MKSPLVVVNCALKTCGAFARIVAGLRSEGRPAAVPVFEAPAFDAPVFEAPDLDVPADLEAGACASEVETRTRLVSSIFVNDFI